MGKVLDGKYKDGDLVLAYIDFGPPCKGSGCGQDAIDRYIKLPNKVVYLSRISFNARPQLYPQPSPTGAPENPFSKYNLPLVVDNSVTISNLEYPEKLNETNPIITLQLFKGNIEEDGQLDPSKLIPVLNDPIFGKIYTTKPGLGPQDSFYSSYGGGFSNKSLVGCRNTDCFLNNALIAFRPDGTCLI